MSIYNNSQGTTKPSFRIGVRGIRILSESVIEGEDILQRIAFKDNEGNTLHPLYKEEVEIPKSYCKKIEQNNNETKFTIRNSDGTESVIVINTRTGGVSGPKTSEKGNIAVFDSETGDSLADSGKKFVDTLTLDENERGLENEIPTGKAITNYVGIISDVLANRIRGK